MPLPIFYQDFKNYRNDISMDDETIALFAEGRKTLGLVHDRLPKDKHPFSTPNDDGDDDDETNPIKTK